MAFIRRPNRLSSLLALMQVSLPLSHSKVLRRVVADFTEFEHLSRSPVLIPFQKTFERSQESNYATFRGFPFTQLSGPRAWPTRL